MADGGRWVTIKGRRVFIEEGETSAQAIERSKRAAIKPKKPQKNDKRMSLNEYFNKVWLGYDDKTYNESPANMDDLTDEEYEEVEKAYSGYHEDWADKRGHRNMQGESDLDMRDRVAEDKVALNKKAWEEKRRKTKRR